MCFLGYPSAVHQPWPASSPEQFKCSCCAGSASRAGSRAQPPTLRHSTQKWSLGAALSWAPCNPKNAWPGLATGSGGNTVRKHCHVLVVRPSFLSSSRDFVLQQIRRFWVQAQGIKILLKNLWVHHFSVNNIQKHLNTDTAMYSQIAFPSSIDNIYCYRCAAPSLHMPQV